MNYKVISLDVWGNATDGYTVNAAYYTSLVVEIADPYNDKEIIKALRDAEYLRKGIHTRTFQIEGEKEYMYINRAKDGRPICELKLDDENG